MAKADIISTNKIITQPEHGIDARQLCPGATEVVERLQQAGYDAYIVGGSVRDLLLGRSPKDFDIATDATPEQVNAVFPRARIIGRRFRLAHVRMAGALLEVATFRGDTNNNQQHLNDAGRILRDNTWGTVEEDAVRRDFTINALFLDPVNSEIRDDVGGYGDLKQGLLRLIGDPETRYRDDPVRLLRAARFVAKLGLDLEPATASPMAELAHLLEDIPPARLFEEMTKLFLTGHAEQTMHALQRFGLTRYLFPVLERGDAPGQARVSKLLWQALRNTDERIASNQSVTPAFLVAALLWQPVSVRAAQLEASGKTEYQALEQAGDELLSEEVRRVAIPRRFSTVTRQIWLNQARLRKTRGRRALGIMRQPRFRASYDFLLLRAIEDPGLQELADFWTEAQENHDIQPDPEPATKRRRPRRRRGGRAKGASGNGQG
jgi:poly(A) polymerase